MNNITEVDAQLFNNKKLLNFKMDLANTLLKDKKLLSFGPDHSFSINYHGIPLTLLFSNNNECKKYENFFPRQWKIDRDQSQLDIFFRSVSSINLNTIVWDDEAEPECAVISDNGREVAIQRDFLGVNMADLGGLKEEVFIIYDEAQDDGFYNAMRWLLPRKMLSKGKLILHSSCVIGHDNKAYFFLGPSGAGKSTVATLAGKRKVLGDDMNVLGVSVEGDIYAEAGGLGGLFDSSPFLGERFPVGGFFWLKQSPTTSSQILSQCTGKLKLIASCANMFWHTNRPSITQQILSLTELINKKYQFSELCFQLNQEFWDYVERK